MFDRASKKLGLEQAVLGTFEKEREDDKPSQEEMEHLLKKGAYALLEDDDKKTQEFCADDIDSILAKRTRTRVVEGAKTSTWLNKQGVSKTKFSADDGEQIDMDDPLFWQKVMPDFVTPSILLQKLGELEEEIEGKVKGPGRGRGRKKKAVQKDEQPTENGEEKKAEDKTEEAAEKENGDDQDDGEVDESVKALLSNETLEDMSEEDEDKSKVQLSRTNIRKVHKFMSDLKSMMESVFDDEDEEGLSKDEKEVCMKLLLTISVKEKMFNDEQRHLARSFLKRLEGGRRRRCRTTDQARFAPGAEDEPASAIPEELMIRGKKRRRRRKRAEIDAEMDGEDGDADVESSPMPKRKKREAGGTYIGEDGYLHHSDSEADWSDVAEDLYQSGASKRDKISRKEARRRRQWAADDDAATAAGRPWPVFPRHLVKKVLSTILEEVMKYDEEQGGIFSVPVPKDEFPEYYEQIKQPMDYGTMKQKLENGEYRSAQAMQKDFILILQNCRTFNAPSSDIVKEARRQHIKRPEILKDAAAKHDLFLAEDGTVLEIFDEEKKGGKKKGKAKKEEGEEAAVEDDAAPKKVRTSSIRGALPKKGAHLCFSFAEASSQEERRRRDWRAN